MSEYEYDFSKGVEQYKRIINGGEADWIPVTTQMAEFCMKYGGHNGHEFFSNPELFVRGSLCLLYTSPSPRDLSTSRMPSSA